MYFRHVHAWEYGERFYDKSVARHSSQARASIDAINNAGESLVLRAPKACVSFGDISACISFGDISTCISLVIYQHVCRC